MLIRRSFPHTPFPRAASFEPVDATSAGPARAAQPRLTLLQQLDRWLWRQEQKSRECYLAGSADRFDFEQRLRRIDRAGAFGFD